MLKIGHFHGLLIIETIGEIPLNEWVERTDISKVRSSELEDRSEEVTQNAIWKDKEMKCIRERVRDTEESVKGLNKSLIVISGEAIFEDIWAENYSELIQDVKPQTQEAQ